MPQSTEFKANREKQKRNFFKISVSLICCALIIITNIFPVFAVKFDKKVVRVGYIGYSGSDIKAKEKGAISSYAQDYLTEISRTTNWEYEFVGGSFSECLERLEKGEIDLLGPLQYSQERGEKFDFPDYEFGYEYSALYSLTTNYNIFYNDYQSFDNITVGLLEANTNNIAFDALCKEHNFSVKKKYYSSITELIKGIENKEVTAIVGGRAIESSNLKVVSRFALEKSYYVTTKGNKEILDGLNFALREIKTNNMAFEADLYKKYYSNNCITKISLSKEEHQFAVANNTLTIVGDPALTPLEYYDEKEKVSKGINVDIVQKIAKELGVQLNYISTKSYEESIQMIQEGKADLIMGDNTHVSKTLLKRTIPYYETNIAIVGRTDTLPKDSPSIAVANEYPDQPKIFDKLPKDIILKKYRNKTECLDAVEKGEADALFMNVDTFEFLNKTNEYGKLTLIGITDEKVEMKIGVSSLKDPLLVSVLNKTIDGLNQEEINTIAISNRNKIEYKSSLLGVIKQYSGLIIGLFFILVASCIITVIYHKNKLTKQLKTIAYKDPITGGRNMEKFRIDARDLFSKFSKDEFTMLYIDIDRFKYINDILGHDGGNDLLAHVTSCLNELLYQYEISARLSADNFVILLKERTPNQIGEFIASLLARIEKFPTLIQLSQTVMVSAGAYKLTAKNESVYEALDKANIARRLVKGLTSRTHAFYDETMQQRIANEIKIVESMQIALDSGEFEVYFQPKRDLRSGRLAGAEALIRWNQDKKVVPPDEFISLFEKNGFITKVDFFVFEQVCKMLSTMKKSGKPLIPISVNLSRVHMQSRDFIGKLKQIAGRYEIPLKSIELELTETVFLQNITELKTIMRTLKDIGFILSMDDFGTGYSSLNLLRELPMDILKIDRTFFNDEFSNPREKTIMKDIVSMAHHLDMRVVSEGVETQRQRELLLDINCDMEQGYLYSRPVPMQDFLDFAELNK